MSLIPLMHIYFTFLLSFAHCLSEFNLTLGCEPWIAKPHIHTRAISSPRTLVLHFSTDMHS